jgi:hypothetical protein
MILSFFQPPAVFTTRLLVAGTVYYKDLLYASVAPKKRNVGTD